MTQNMTTNHTTASTTQGPTRWTLAFLILSSMLTMMGAAAVAPALPGISAAFPDYPETTVALIVTIPSLAIVLTSWLVGIICDRVGKVRPLLVSLAFFAIFGSSGAYLSSLEMIIAGRALLGVGIAGIMTATTALISSYYTGPERMKAIALQAAGMGIGVIVLEVAGGVLASIDWRVTFFIYLISLLFIPGVYLTAKEPKVTGAGHEEEDIHFEHEPSRIHIGPVLLIFVGIFCEMLMMYMLPTKLPYLLYAAGITSTVVCGALLGVAGFVSAFSGLLGARLNLIFSRQTLVSSGFFLIAIGSLIISTATELIILICGLAVFGIGMGFIVPMLVGWLSHLTPPHKYGTIFGLYSAFFFLGQFASGFVAQPLIDMTGSYASVFSFNVVLGIVLAVIFGASAIVQRTRQKKPAESDPIC